MTISQSFLPFSLFVSWPIISANICIINAVLISADENEAMKSQTCIFMFDPFKIKSTYETNMYVNKLDKKI